MEVESARFHGIVNGESLWNVFHILLPNYTNFKTLGQFENFVFVIMSIRENIRLIAISSLSGKAILKCLIPILVGVIYDALSALRPSLRVWAPINEVKDSIVQRNQECAKHGK